MTYQTEIAESQQEPFPEFFEFEQGGNYERYTSFNESLVFRGVTYAAAPIRRGTFSYDTQFGSVNVDITAPISDIFAAYIGNLPIEPVNVVIYRAIKSDLTDYIILFTGTVKMVTVKDRTATAKLEANSSWLFSKIPNVIYQAFCNHDVFDTGCALLETNWEVIATITTISGYNIESATFGGFADGYFTGGNVRLSTDFRLVTNHVGNVLSLQLPFDLRLQVGNDVVVLPGCDGNPSTCVNKYDNLLKFLGMPYIPSNNPAVWGFR
jgi:uncharacterized phage protein (TIGR02218 family)